MNRNDDIDKFVKMVKQIKSLIAEFSILSKKSPNDAVNKFKIKLINPVLSVANDFIKGAQYKPFEDFEMFAEEDVPTNSDVLVILTQYNACLAKYFDDNTQIHEYNHYWCVKGKLSSVESPSHYSGI